MTLKVQCSRFICAPPIQSTCMQVKKTAVPCKTSTTQILGKKMWRFDQCWLNPSTILLINGFYRPIFLIDGFDQLVLLINDFHQPVLLINDFSTDFTLHSSLVVLSGMEMWSQMDNSWLPGSAFMNYSYLHLVQQRHVYQDWIHNQEATMLLMQSTRWNKNVCAIFFIANSLLGSLG